MELKKKYSMYRKFSLLMLVIMVAELLHPVTAYALTGGPSQPEVESFEPVNTTEMVDPFTGDFNYNIPLLDVGGYPINISYHAEPGMDQEASWVGLGWNINPGVINRNMRGLPDDFKGDLIKKEMNVRTNFTVGVEAGAEWELFGKQLKQPFEGALNAGLGINYNNYRGFGVEISVAPGIKRPWTSSSATMSLGLNSSSENGLDIVPAVSFSDRYSKVEGFTRSSSLSATYNRREGLKEISLSFSATKRTITDRSIIRAVKQGWSNPGYYSAMANQNNSNFSYSFATTMYTPGFSMPMGSFGLAFQANLGIAFFANEPNVSLSAYYNEQFLKEQQQEKRAYGYFYSQHASEDVMMDMNREHDLGSVNRYTPNLALPNYTYDVYGVSGQGIGGMYRPFRGDVGVLHDPVTKSTGSNISVGGIELGTGAGAAHVGYNGQMTKSNSKSSYWNLNQANLNFADAVTGDPFYEPFFFKSSSELAPVNENYYAMTGGDRPVRVELDHAKPEAFAKRRWIDDRNNTHDINRKVVREGRDHRTQVISPLTFGEMQVGGLQKNIVTYTANNFSGYNDTGFPNCTTVNTAGRPKHHIAEYTVLRPDGARYVYGIPAYNNTQVDATFNIGKTNLGDGSPYKPDCSNGLVKYTAEDASIDNKNGEDHYFMKMTVPAFAHSYLLTNIVSPDYVDVTGDGPSDDDIGTYTKINYTRVAENYKWRVPYQRDMASYDEGLKSVPFTSNDADDKASYVYGEKEVWLIHSIETRNYVAVFYTSDREDALGVQDERGGYDAAASAKSRKLDKIVLYSKQDLLAHPTHPTNPTESNATPIKTVHFEYDYSLCDGVPNSTTTSGKLTLKKIWFTYGKSNKGVLNSYEFAYNSMNPNYDLKSQNRWGAYQPNNGVCYYNDPTNSALFNHDFPYTRQGYISTTEKEADHYVQSWMLKTVKLPSGSLINIEYEADDYAFVQDKTAMEMYTLEGAFVNVSDLDTDDGTKGDKLMNPHGWSSAADEAHEYLVFKLKKPLSGSLTSTIADNYVREYYTKGINNLFYRVLVNVNRLKNTWDKRDAYFDYVTGYAEIVTSGAYKKGSATDYEYGYIKIKKQCLKDIDANDCGEAWVHPFTKQAWQFSRIHTPRYAYNTPDVAKSDFVSFFKAFLVSARNFGEMVNGINRILNNNDVGKLMIAEKSFIRLNCPDGFKKGGGHRVRSITVNDQWKEMMPSTGHESYQTSTYGQVFDYTMEENGRTISSGVASYEPMIGGEENPFRQPIYYTERRVLAPSEEYFKEEPYGESFFQAPIVGYRKIRVKSYVPDDLPSGKNLTRHGTGSIVYEFFTAKDYPVIVARTDMDPARYKPHWTLSFMKLVNKEYLTCSQGFSIELNDMHGKLRKMTVYSEGDKDVISSQEYFYKTQKPDGAESKPKLDNKVTVMHKDGTISESVLGMDYDFFMDSRKTEDHNFTAGLRGNLDAFMAGIFPFAAAIPFPKIRNEKTMFRSVVTTKVIQRYGLLEKTVTTDLGSTVTTRNLMYDSETGGVLLTEVTNPYEDPIYSFNYPAYWGYDRMGPAYRNIGLRYDVVNPSSFTNANLYFVPGDELYVKAIDPASSFTPVKGWVKTVSATAIVIIDKNGNTISAPTGGFNLKVIRSGRRNLQAATMGAVSTLLNPVRSAGANQYTLDFKQVLDASAVEYTEEWKAYCDCGFNPASTFNPYTVGRKGNWRVKRKSAYLTDRIQTQAQNNVNIRKDGVYKDFNPFWTKPVAATSGISLDWTPGGNNWVMASEVTEYNRNGFELENKDPLKIYSAAEYRYNEMIPTSVSANARYAEVGSDNFEDYGMGTCTQGGHFDFREDYSGNVTGTNAHTGRKSIQVPANTTYTLEKQLQLCE